MAEPFTEDEITAFLAQLDAFRRTLSARQQHLLDILLEAAAVTGREGGIDPDVEGFIWRPPRTRPLESRRVVHAVHYAAVAG